MVGSVFLKCLSRVIISSVERRGGGVEQWRAFRLPCLPLVSVVPKGKVNNNNSSSSPAEKRKRDEHCAKQMRERGEAEIQSVHFPPRFLLLVDRSHTPPPTPRRATRCLFLPAATGERTAQAPSAEKCKKYKEVILLF
eukprot:Hpha_TRINITY_DN16520_c0_g1::TRINITY_DN16520_c0_g1_i1::g.132733::m.132733